MGRQFPPRYGEFEVTPFYADNEICCQEVRFSIPYDLWTEFEKSRTYRELVAFVQSLETQDAMFELQESENTKKAPAKRGAGEKGVRIHDAIKARTGSKPFITRLKWIDGPYTWRAASIKIQPTNSPDGCIVESKTNRVPSRGWQPTEEDMLADDWVVVG